MNLGSPNLVVVWMGYQGGTTPNLSDSVNGSGFTQLDPTASILGGLKYIACFYRYGSLGSYAAATFTSNGSGSYPSIVAYGYSATISSDPFVAQTSHGREDSSAVIKPANGTPLASASGSLLTTGFWPFTASGTNPTIDSSFGNVVAVGYNVSYPISGADLISSGSSVDPQWTTPGGTGQTYLMAQLVNFQETAAAGGQPTMRRWGGTEFMGGQGIGNKGKGRMWGRSTVGLYVPRRFAA